MMRGEKLHTQPAASLLLQDTAMIAAAVAPRHLRSTVLPLAPPPLFPPDTSPPHYHNRSVLQSLPLDEKRAFLQFATGCDRAPVAGLKALNLLVQVGALLLGACCVLCVCVCGGGQRILDGPTGMRWG